MVASLGYRGGIAVGPDGTLFVAVRESAPDAGDGFIARVDPVTGAGTTQPLARAEVAVVAGRGLRALCVDEAGAVHLGAVHGREAHYRAEAAV